MARDDSVATKQCNAQESAHGSSSQRTWYLAAKSCTHRSRAGHKHRGDAHQCRRRHAGHRLLYAVHLLRRPEHVLRDKGPPGVMRGLERQFSTAIGTPSSPGRKAAIGANALRRNGLWQICHRAVIECLGGRGGHGEQGSGAGGKGRDGIRGLSALAPKSSRA